MMVTFSLWCLQKGIRHHIVREYYDKNAKLQYSDGNVWNYHRYRPDSPWSDATVSLYVVMFQLWS